MDLVFAHSFHLLNNDFKHVLVQEYIFVYKNDPFVSYFSSNVLDFVPKNYFLIGNIFLDIFCTCLM